MRQPRGRGRASGASSTLGTSHEPLDDGRVGPVLVAGHHESDRSEEPLDAACGRRRPSPRRADPERLWRRRELDCELHLHRSILTPSDVAAPGSPPSRHLHPDPGSLVRSRSRGFPPISPFRVKTSGASSTRPGRGPGRATATTSAHLERPAPSSPSSPSASRHPEVSVGVAPVVIGRFQPHVPAGTPQLEVSPSPSSMREESSTSRGWRSPGSDFRCSVLDLLRLQDKKYQTDRTALGLP